MVAITGTAIVTAIGGAVAWINSLPGWLKYFVFLAGLYADTLVEGALGGGFVSSVLSYVIGTVFQVQGFVVYSWQILILASVSFFIFYLFNTQT